MLDMLRRTLCRTIKKTMVIISSTDGMLDGLNSSTDFALGEHKNTQKLLRRCVRELSLVHFSVRPAPKAPDGQSKQAREFDDALRFHKNTSCKELASCVALSSSTTNRSA